MNVELFRRLTPAEPDDETSLRATTHGSVRDESDADVWKASETMERTDGDLLGDIRQQWLYADRRSSAGRVATHDLLGNSAGDSHQCLQQSAD